MFASRWADRGRRRRAPKPRTSLRLVYFLGCIAAASPGRSQPRGTVATSGHRGANGALAPDITVSSTIEDVFPKI